MNFNLAKLPEDVKDAFLRSCLALITDNYVRSFVQLYQHWKFTQNGDRVTVTLDLDKHKQMVELLNPKTVKHFAPMTKRGFEYLKCIQSYTDDGMVGFTYEDGIISSESNDNANDIVAITPFQYALYWSLPLTFAHLSALTIAELEKHDHEDAESCVLRVILDNAEELMSCSLKSIPFQDSLGSRIRMRYHLFASDILKELASGDVSGIKTIPTDLPKMEDTEFFIHCGPWILQFGVNATQHHIGRMRQYHEDNRYEWEQELHIDAGEIQTILTAMVLVRFLQVEYYLIHSAMQNKPDNWYDQPAEEFFKEYEMYCGDQWAINTEVTPNITHQRLH